MAILDYATTIVEMHEGTPSGVGDSTTGSTAYTRRSIITYSASPLAYLEWNSTSEIWCSFRMRGNLDDSTGDMVVVYADNGDAVFRMQKNNNSTSNIDFEWHDGTSWTDFKSSWGDSSYYTVARWDIRIKIDAIDGAIDVYKDGRLDVSIGPVDTTNAGTRSGLTQFRIGSWSGEGWYSLSAIIIADEPTLVMDYVQTWPAGNGTYNEWDGADYTFIDGVDFDDAEMIESETLDARYTYTLPTVTTDFDTGHEVAAVCSSARVYKGNVEGKNFCHMVRSGTSDSYGPTRSVDLIKRPSREIFETDPATGTTWSMAAAKAAEIGFQIKN